MQQKWEPWDSIFKDRGEVSSTTFRMDSVPGHPLWLLHGAQQIWGLPFLVLDKHPVQGPEEAGTLSGVTAEQNLQGRSRQSPFLQMGTAQRNDLFQRQQAAWQQQDVLKGDMCLYVSTTVFKGLPTLGFSLYGNRNYRSHPSDNGSSVSQ